MKNELRNFAGSIAERLIAEGFIVQRYDAHTTDSVYLKLDYGVCNSIRISSHAGIRKEQKNNDCGSGYLQSDVVYYNYRRGDSI